MKLSGVIPACILPMHPDGSIDETAYAAHLEQLVSTPGVRGLTCNGHAAEVSTLSREERRRAVDIAVATVAGRVPVICGIHARDHREAAAYAGDARAAGADALLVLPPDSLAHDADPAAALRHFEHVASTVPLPLVAFVYPDFTGMQYGAQLLERICTLDAVVAIKEWSLDIRVYERNLGIARSAGHEVTMLSSFSTNLLPTLALGADGILSGHGSVVAGLQAQLYERVAAGDLAGAREVYGPLQTLTAVVYRDPMPNMYARMKEQLVMLGAELTPTVRAPLVPVTEAERADLRRALSEAGLLPAGARS
ncbi:dihydrodipicolinate synthase family protein [Pseudonocardia kunmingensis]|uniref:4-hydroxy-tetrahydrodipicolinate synthase n=1 Tax=Pseudonocardia kunmingensis TaxID=630975 RepID=A0A543DVL3_9PSEU|nr:dihydrodipicolinate synthase family protein [Pseudonocardia kunmingensis]TQM13368.1 4-hydroxy-tetrahydrodipicolinate synthase [Pseudonocardia kunmingensis]